ncbi:OPT superfamily oligopeptide transporter [Xylariaceae sp. FL0804]|nr:OPT superfamily oligopeptide transporter [Xylariaceae sp. FL0804]
MATTSGLYATGDTAPEIEKMTAEDIKHDHARSASVEAGTPSEKGELFNVRRADSGDDDDGILMLSHEEPFPVDPDAPVEVQQFTVRAVLVGSILGGVIAASNVYLGLKTGWTFGAALFGSIFGFAILKPLSRALPPWAGGGYFGPKENVVCQSAATAAGSLGLLFTSGFPAAYQLGLLGRSPREDFGRLVTFTIACAYYGMFFAIPLRKFYVLKQKLAFPSAVAAAFAVRSLHTSRDAEANARRKVRAIALAFALAIAWKCVAEYAPGILWDWHWGWTLYRLGWKQAIQVENWNWVVEFTPAFIGVGLLIGLNGAYSFFGGSIIAWAIIGPILVSTGTAVGTAISPEYPGYMEYMGMVLDDPVNSPSPRYWMLWPGVMLLLAGAFSEIFANYKSIGASFASLLEPLYRRLFRRDVHVHYDESEKIQEPCPPEELVPAWMWGGGIVLSIVFTCAVLGTQFHQNVGVVILAILFAFLFSFIGAESSGRTNVNPVTSIGNASQLVLGGANHGHGSLQSQQLLNITGSLLALGAAEQASDMLGDLKTTHLLRASPRAQFYAQCCGAVVSVFMSTAMYVLFSTAYPCINDLAQQDNCAFSVPDVGPYRAIAVAVTSPELPIPPSSGYFSIAILVYAFLQTFVKYRFIPPKYHHFVPNLVGVGVAFILNTTTYPTAMAFGATLAALWRRNYPAAFAMYCYAIAAGMIAGEGLGGIVGAILQVAGVSGSYYGAGIGCPMGEYCG